MIAITLVLSTFATGSLNQVSTLASMGAMAQIRGEVPVGKLQPQKRTTIAVTKEYGDAVTGLQQEILIGLKPVVSHLQPPNTLLRVMVWSKRDFSTTKEALDFLRRKWGDESGFERTAVLLALLHDDVRTADIELAVGKEFPLGKLAGVDLNSKEGPLKDLQGGVSHNLGPDVGRVLIKFYTMMSGPEGAIPWERLTNGAFVLLILLIIVKPKPSTMPVALHTGRFGDNFPWTQGLWGTLHALGQMACVYMIVLRLGQYAGAYLPMPSYLSALFDTPMAHVAVVGFAFWQMRRVQPITMEVLSDMGLGFKHTPKWDKILCGILTALWLILAVVACYLILQLGGGRRALLQGFLNTALLVPIHEEAVYRLVFLNYIHKGILNELYARMRASGNTISVDQSRVVEVMAIIASAVIFMAPHILFFPARWQGVFGFMVILTAAGLLNGGAYLKTRTLVAAVLAHAVYNGALECLTLRSRFPH